jgi:hypothetical protein
MKSFCTEVRLIAAETGNDLRNFATISEGSLKEPGLEATVRKDLPFWLIPLRIAEGKFLSRIDCHWSL